MSTDKYGELVDPIPRPSGGQLKVTLKPKERRVLFMDNGKPNSLPILRGAQAELRRRGVEVEEDILAKEDVAGQNPAHPISGELLGRLSRYRGLILTGIND